MTLEEIKALVYQTEEINWIDVLKDLVKIKFGEDILVKLENECGWGSGIYLYSVGDPNEYLIGVAVINDKLFAMTDDGDGCYVEFGTTWFGNAVKHSEGIGLTKDAIIKTCRKIFDGLTSIVFNFQTKEDLHSGWYKEYFLEKLESSKDEFESFVKGETKGYLSIT